MHHQASALSYPNAKQIDGLPAHFYATVPPLNSDIKPLDAVESFSPAPRPAFSTAAAAPFQQWEDSQHILPLLRIKFPEHHDKGSPWCRYQSGSRVSSTI